MPGPLTLVVPGVPAPQGSKRHVGNGVMVESSKRVAPWRRAVHAACIPHSAQLYTGPVVVRVACHFARPASHYGTGRNSKTLRATAPRYPVSRSVGDADKLGRAVLDGLTRDPRHGRPHGILGDDALVVGLWVAKSYSVDGWSGAVITVSEPPPGDIGRDN